MTPIVISETCACERNDWERRPGTDGDLIVCRTCGYIGLIAETPGTVSVHRVTLSLCSLCLTGAGGECHTPGCSLWMHRAPDTRVYLDVEPATAGDQGNPDLGTHADLPDPVHGGDIFSRIEASER